MNGIFLWIVAVLISGASPLPGIVQTIAGGGQPHKGKKNECNDIENSKDGVGEEARFNYPWGVAYNFHKNVLYVADCGCVDSEHKTDLLREVDIATGAVRTIAGSTQGFSDGFGKEAHFKHIAGISLDPELNLLYIADSGNHRIRVLYVANNKVDTITGLPIPGFVDQTLISSQFNNPQSVVVSRNIYGERSLYVADTDNHAIRVIYLKTDESGDVKTIAGGKKGFQDGKGIEARFYHPSEVVVDGLGEYLFISDGYNNAIRRLEIRTGMVTTLTEKGFELNEPRYATFNYPEGLAFDPDNQLLYVCEFEHHDILVFTMTGDVKSLAGFKKGKQDGIGKKAKFNHPSGLTFDRKTRTLYVTDQYNHLVRSVSGIGSNQAYDPDARLKKRKQIQNEMAAATRRSPWLFLMSLFSAIVFFLLLIIKPCMKKLYSIYNRPSLVRL